MYKILNRDLYAGIFIWVCLWAVLSSLAPAFPIDETRYLTVAWEMHHSGDYILPTLNWAPYSHKPPMLFWLINLVWSFTGLSVGAARAIPLLSSLATLFLTIKLARHMFPKPEESNVPTFSGLTLMAMPVFMIYGVMIMFDFMQAACVVLAMIAAWDAYSTKRFKSWLLFGFATGLGVLAKGPVILVHVMPVVLLFPVLMGKAWDGPRLKMWYGGIAFSFLVTLLIGMAWAVPAAIHGGPEFTHMIFWEQSAGRVSKSFAHRQPFWFYVPVMLVFLLPLLFWSPFWGSVKKVFQARKNPAILFLLCWTIPVFIIFSMISGKQAHYLIPMLPGVAILLGRFINDQNINVSKLRNMTCIIPVTIGFMALAGVQYYPGISRGDNMSYLLQGLHEFNVSMVLGQLIAVLIFSTALILGGRRENQLLAMIFAFAIFFGTTIGEANKKLLGYYDLTPLATELQKYEDYPIAFAPKYAGEIGFLARLKKPVSVLPYRDIPQWLKTNRQGVVVMRYENETEIKDFKPVFTMHYRGSDYISIVKRK